MRLGNMLDLQSASRRTPGAEAGHRDMLSSRFQLLQGQRAMDVLGMPRGLGGDYDQALSLSQGALLSLVQILELGRNYWDYQLLDEHQYRRG